MDNNKPTIWGICIECRGKGEEIMSDKINNSRSKLAKEIQSVIDSYELTYGDVLATLEAIKYEMLVEGFNLKKKKNS